jgi:hypothetical protein
MDQNTHQCYDSGSSCPEIEDFLNCLLRPGTAKASPIFVASKIEHPDRRFYQGLAFMQEFEDQEAINSFIKFMQEKPQSVGASFNLAVLYHEDGICEELCCHYFRNALVLARSSSERRVVTLQFASGRIQPRTQTRLNARQRSQENLGGGFGGSYFSGTIRRRVAFKPRRIAEV